MIKQWFTEQIDDIYWLVEDNTLKQAIEANGELSFPDTRLVFQGEMFDAVISLSPWLLPVTESVRQLPEQVLQQGMYLSCTQTLDVLLSHLQSLLIAALDGEEVLFRFYDPQVLLPMLDTMDEQELSALLGPAERLTTFLNGQHCQWYSDVGKQYQPRLAPWWIIKPHHLTPLYRTDVHAKILERRLWECLPDALTQLEKPSQVFEAVLNDAKKNGKDYEYAERLVLSHLINETSLTLEAVRDALHLEQKECEEIFKLRETTYE
ncbi:hypothetical protein BZJ17_15320 [Salinivibrio sp. IB574]|uniref:DUF4123 domain-containing protein n=1 Tax=Salinivibrio sp. IB574 TaxID=1909444 RepID=UPI0009C5C77B|nr:DUF4123 domain-containing protein [Salinivibrio sp. IB574]OOF19424.1 hypothetical protein BZJ17_15320 [Salinivibrio sp. IB574]